MNIVIAYYLLHFADAANFNEEWEKNGKNNGDAAIPLMLQNQVPMGFETDDSLDVSLRPDEVKR